MVRQTNFTQSEIILGEDLHRQFCIGRELYVGDGRLDHDLGNQIGQTSQFVTWRLTISEPGHVGQLEPVRGDTWFGDRELRRERLTIGTDAQCNRRLVADTQIGGFQ